jgi:hypothetical protein
MYNYTVTEMTNKLFLSTFAKGAVLSGLVVTSLSGTVFNSILSTQPSITLSSVSSLSSSTVSLSSKSSTFSSIQSSSSVLSVVSSSNSSQTSITPQEIVESLPPVAEKEAAQPVIISKTENKDPGTVVVIDEPPVPVTVIPPPIVSSSSSVLPPALSSSSVSSESSVNNSSEVSQSTTSSSSSVQPIVVVIPPPVTTSSSVSPVLASPITLIKDCSSTLAITTAQLALTRGAQVEKAPSISCDDPNLQLWLNAIQTSMYHYSPNFFLPGTNYLNNGGLLQIKIQPRLTSTIGELIGVADHDQVWLSNSLPYTSTVEHELFHVTDFQIYGDYSSLTPDPVWNALNVTGFTYTNYNLAFTSFPQGFAEPYGMASWSEDRATIYEGYRDGTLAAKLLTDPVLAKKWEFLKQQLITVGVLL